MLSEEQKEKISNAKEAATTLLAEQRIASISPAKIYSDPSMHEEVSERDPISGVELRMPRWYFKERLEEREAIEEARAAEERRKIQMLEQEQRIAQSYEDSLSDIPEEQLFVRGANTCDRVWGRNNLVCVVREQHATKMKVGDKWLIIAANDGELAHKQYQQWARATFVEPVAISDWYDEKLYPGLGAIAKALKAGKRAPVLEVCPGAGTPRLGANGEACLFINAQHVWMEFQAKHEKELGQTESLDQKEGIFKRLWNLLHKVAGWRNR